MSELERISLKKLGKELSGRLDDFLSKRAENKTDNLSITGFDYEHVNRIIEAKNEWESSVDALEKLAILVLDKDLNIVRANKTIELWG